MEGGAEQIHSLACLVAQERSTTIPTKEYTSKMLDQPAQKMTESDRTAPLPFSRLPHNHVSCVVCGVSPLFGLHAPSPPRAAGKHDYRPSAIALRDVTQLLLLPNRAARPSQSRHPPFVLPKMLYATASVTTSPYLHHLHGCHRCRSSPSSAPCILAVTAAASTIRPAVVRHFGA
jgi:hypothetical protein